MANKYTSVPHGDLGSGIDVLSAEDSIPEGYSEDLVNADPTPEGYLVKRPGYQGKFGFLPVRVIEADYTSASTQNLTLTLDRSIDLSGIGSQTGSRPIVVEGRTSSANANNAGDFPSNGTDATHYYPYFNADSRVTFANGTHTLTIPASESGLISPLMFVGTAASTSTSDHSNSVFIPDDISITQSNESIAVTYTNDLASFPGFIYWLQKEASPGSVYVSGNISQPATTTTTTTITAATHGLSTPNIQVKAYINSAGVYQLIVPDTVTVAPNDDVTVVITNDTASPFNVVFILSDAPILNEVQGVVPAATTQTITLTGLTSPFIFATCYLELTPGGNRQEVLPDSIVINAATATASITFTNEMASTANFFIYWDAATIATNRITVDASVIGGGDAYSDTLPQLTIWGLDHSVIYKSTAAARAGWVTHLDTYKAPGEAFLVSGLGGNLFNGQAASSAIAQQYLIPQSFYPSLRARTAADALVGPTFTDTLADQLRTRGTISGDALDGFATASSVTYDSGSGYVQVVIPITNMQVHGTFSTVITTTAGLEDQLTIQSAGWNVHNGIWPIKQATQGVNQLTLLVAIPAVTSSDYDDLNSGAQVGIFTDRMTLDRTSPFIPGDVLLADTLLDNQQVTCTMSSGTTLLIGGLDANVEFPSGLRIAGTRAGSIIPLRLIDETRSVDDLVTGDNLAITGFVREFRAKSLNTLSDINVTVVGNPTAQLATVTLGSGDTSRIAPGDGLLLTQAGVYTGEVTVSTVPSSTTFTFESSQSGTVAGILFGKTVQVDESFTWSDAIDSSISIAVPGRWLPFEAPNTTANEPPNTHISYLPQSAYDNQPILRSTQVNDTLILNNGVDRTLKVDGTSVYRPGLTRWQAQLFLTTATAATPTPVGGKIVLTPTICALKSPFWANNHFTVDAADVDTYAAGARIQVDAANTPTFVVQSSVIDASDSTTGLIYVDQDISSAIGAPGAGPYNLSNTFTYSYYFRLNAVDANQNVIASAVTGSFDWSIAVSEDFQARLRLVGLPTLDVYDYDRLEVQVYRTKSNGVAPYYLLTTLPMNFNKNRGYIDYVDTASDEDLTELDPVNTALKGQELGTGWSQPIRAKRVTSASKRLILGNLSSDPQLDLRLVTTGPVISAGVLTGTRYFLRKDNTDTGTITDMVNRIGYQFIGVATGRTITGITVGSGNFTVNTTSHGLSVGDWVYLWREAAPTTNQQTHFMGWWQVSAVVDADNYTVDWPDVPASITFSDEVNSQIAATDPRDVPIFLGTDYNYGYTDGNKIPSSATVPYENIATRRFANAVNATQRMVNRNISGFENFMPWIVADAGGEFATGEIILRQPNSQNTTFSLQLPVSISGYNIYANQVLRSANEHVGAITLLFPSRILASYPNFAEIFDSPFATIDSQSDSAVDVNPDDGQEVTACIPFFGASAFGAALKDAVVVVFKSNSIYIVNLAQKAAGQNPIQRIESQGLGCTMPNSVTPVRDGIMFANESGMYKLKTDLSVYYMGRHMQRLWREQVNQSQLDLIFGHNYSFGSLYKLSVPVLPSVNPDQVFVYNSIREYSLQGITNSIQLYQSREGSWTRHDSINSIGWANLNADSFYAGLHGRVFILRRTGLVQDYRDDDQPIALSATLRAMDFGDEGVRKTVPYAMVTYRNPLNEGDRTGTVVSYSTDLSDFFTPADPTFIPNRGEPTGLGDLPGQKAISYRYSFNQKRGVRFQLQLANAVKDEPIEITKVRYDVAGLSVKGIREAATPQAAAVTK